MNANSQIIQTLMQVIDAKDRYTAGHCNRVYMPELVIDLIEQNKEIN